MVVFDTENNTKISSSNKNSEMNNVDFSFGVLTYNSGKFILETLFSILHQINKFGCERKIQLVVGDDASSDNTQELIYKWISKYKCYFEKIDIIVSEKNEGTVSNYNKVLRKIESSYFSIIAGDDLYADENVFMMSEQIGENACISSIPLSLAGEALFLEKNRLWRLIDMINLDDKNNKKLLGKEIMGSYIHTPSTLFYKELYTADVIDFVNQFDLFEDDPRWYMFIKKEVAFRFCICPFIIYRYHDTSVAHSNNERTITRFDADRMRLFKIYMLQNRLPCYLKIYLFSKIKQIKTKKKFNFSNFFRVLERYKTCINPKNRRLYKAEKILLMEALKKNQLFYDNIKQDCLRFREEK